MNRREVIKGLTALGALSFLPVNLFKQKGEIIHFVSLGDAGAIALSYIKGKIVSKNAKYTYVNSHSRSNMSEEFDFIEFKPPGYSVTNFHGHKMSSADMNAEIVIPDNLKELFSANKKYIILAALGRHTATNLAAELALYLHNNNNTDFLMICSSPFSFEGNVNMKYAKSALAKMPLIDNIKHIELEEMLKKWGDLVINEAFRKADECFLEVVQDNIPIDNWYL